MEKMYGLKREALIKRMENYNLFDEFMEDNSMIRLDDLSDRELVDFAIKLEKYSENRNKDINNDDDGLNEEDLEGLREMAEYFSKE